MEISFVDIAIWLGALAVAVVAVFLIMDGE